MGKKIIYLLLFSAFFANTNTFATKPIVPQNNRLRQKENAAHILTKDDSYIGIYIGGALTIAGLALIIYSKIQRNKLENSKTEALNNLDTESLNLEELTHKIEESIEKDMAYYENYYLYGGTLSAVGLLVFFIFLFKKFENKNPVVVLNELGISADEKSLKQTESNHIELEKKSYTPQSNIPHTYTVHTPYDYHTRTIVTHPNTRIQNSSTTNPVKLYNSQYRNPCDRYQSPCDRYRSPCDQYMSPCDRFSRNFN